MKKKTKKEIEEAKKRKQLEKMAENFNYQPKKETR